MVKKQKKKQQQLWSRPSVWLLCVNSSTDQWASLSCESVSSKRVSCFLNSSSMQQLCHTWLRCFRQPQRSITTAKSLMSFCTALEYLIPQAALPCIYVNSEHPQSSGELNKKGQGPEKFLNFFFLFFLWHLWGWTFSMEANSKRSCVWTTSRTTLLILEEQRHFLRVSAPAVSYTFIFFSREGKTQFQYTPCKALQPSAASSPSVSILGSPLSCFS